MSYPKKSRRGVSSVIILIMVIVIVPVGFSLVRYLMDRGTYQEAHRAYLRANCAAAVGGFDSIIDAWRLAEIGKYVALAKQEKGECMAFSVAVNTQQAEHLGQILMAYLNFVTAYDDSVLVAAVLERNKIMFEQSQPAALANQETCQRLDALLEKGLIPYQDSNLPPFYLACGQIYTEIGSQQDSFAMYKAFLTEYPDHAQVREAVTSILANPIVCGEVESLRAERAIAKRPNFLPKLYHQCSREFADNGDWETSQTLSKYFLTSYADHPLAADVAATLLENPGACEEISLLEKYSTQTGHSGFLPKLYYTCGQACEKDGDWTDAIALYEDFLAGYSDHALAADVEAGLARATVAYAKEVGAQDISAPESTGRTGNKSAEVIIQNDSPERIRIVFSGPEARVEELGACSSCENYVGVGPLICPEKGPVGSYTLQPGEYDVVVEAISDSGITPWLGEWNLDSGDEYSNCFFIVTTYGF
jgi:hypothetical protein